jgi:regulator of nucleoside diphosphate kinase
MRNIDSLRSGAPQHRTGLASSARETPIRVTEEDRVQLLALVDRALEGAEAAAAELLELELERAEILPAKDMPANVITMRSKAVYEDVGTGKRMEAELAFPEEADPANSKISVLAPVGIALLGLGEGQSIAWQLPRGRSRTWRVLNVIQPPESADPTS